MVVTEVDLTVLRAQLFLLEHDAVNLQKEVRSMKQQPDLSDGDSVLVPNTVTIYNPG
jgi:hypothetical protein